MNCGRMEELLPRLFEGDVTQTERAAAAEHMNGCARCRDAHATFASLECILTDRRDESPPPRTFADAVTARLGERRSPLRLVPRWFVPALAASAAFALFGSVLARHAIPSGAVVTMANALHSMAALCAMIPRWIVEAAGSDLRIVLAAYLILTVSLAAAGRVMVSRIMQE